MQAVRRNASTDIGNAYQDPYMQDPYVQDQTGTDRRSQQAARLSTVTCPRVMVGGLVKVS
jgi:hypothetical protein